MAVRTAKAHTSFEASRDERAHLVRQLRRRGIRDVEVLKAFGDVPREAFVPDDEQAHAYEDRPLPIGVGQTISQPYIVAVMIEALGLGRGERVLEVGAGSGYAAALLSTMGARVTALERVPALVDYAKTAFARAGIEGVSLHVGDGRLGWPQGAPFDAILVSAAAADVPAALLDQLAVGGRLVAPVGQQESAQMLIRIQRPSLESYSRETLCAVQFVPLLGGIASTE